MGSTQLLGKVVFTSLLATPLCAQ